MALENSTRWLEKAIHDFDSQTCVDIPTYALDLPSEDAAHAKQKQNPLVAPSDTTGGQKIQKLNLSTYKLQPSVTMWMPFGSTGLAMVTWHKQWVQSFLLARKRTSCLFQGKAEHKRVKKHYKQVSKSNFTRGITQQNHHKRTLWKM
jgi:hypothetical protein